jgi:maltooligosyltrehalose trehalohydrolase
MRKQRFGPIVRDEGVRFQVWAPGRSAIGLLLEGREELAMTSTDDGFFVADVSGIGAGQRYWFCVGEALRADPASRFQPDGPLGPSAIVDARAFAWSDSAWTGALPARQQVIYEMHLGTFTTEGTWEAARARLPYLADVGVTTLEIMPLAEFAGEFGWGYDGVNLFAPSRLYGTPDDARRFIDDAHRQNLAVILDVVYNHFGPVGNFMSEFSPMFQGAPGEWGDSINYDGPGSAHVRAFMIENASYWIEEFHFDGLRFDATQAIHDRSREHIVAELCAAARSAAGTRSVFLVGESEPQDTRLLRQSGACRDGLDAIWSEDWHHAAFVALTGRREAYFTDYRGDAPEFASMARHGTLYQGQWYTWQTGPRGGYALDVSPGAFVNFLENHDQVANTGLGSRLHERAEAGKWRALTTLLLLGPALPMLFQGQEFGSTSPFTYFADHEGDLANAVRNGRLEFLRQFPGLATAEMQARLPDPDDATVFERCKLQDGQRTAEGPMVRLHRDLLRIRRTDQVLSRMHTEGVRLDSSAPTRAIVLVRTMAAQGHRLLVVNLGDDHVSAMNDPLLAPLRGSRWELQWSSEHPDYGGGGAMPFVDVGRWLIQGAAAMLLRTR